MLVRFAVENFLCFSQPVSLDLGSDPIAALAPSNALLVGENGTGKSSLQKALACLRNLTLGGSRPGQPLPVSPSLLAAPASPTRFELAIHHEGALWTYGFTATTERVHSEWLTRQPAGASSALPVFAREQLTGTATSVEFGDFLADERPRRDHLAYGTRPEQLFLNEALRRNVRPLLPLGTWLRDRLQLILPEPKIVGLASRAAREPDFLAFLGELLRESGTGLEAVEVERSHIEPETFESEEEQRELLAALTSFPDAFAETQDGELIAEPVEGTNRRMFDLFQLRLRCRLAGSDKTLPAAELSDGTQRLLHLATVLYQSPERPAGRAPIFFVDDVGRCLHPRLLERLIRRFVDGNARILPELERAQLIATAYDMQLVEAGLLQPEQVFLLKRGEGGVELRRMQNRE